MRELNVNEIKNVNGGLLAFGAILGAITGGASAAADDGDLGDVISGAFMGAIAGFFGGAAGKFWSAGYKTAGGVFAGGSTYFSALPSLTKR